MMHVIVSSKLSSDTPDCPGRFSLVAGIVGTTGVFNLVTSRSTGVELIWPDRPSAARRASRRDSTVGRGETGSGGEAIFHKVDHCNRLVLTDHTIFSTTQAGTVSCKNNERVHPVSSTRFAHMAWHLSSLIVHRAALIALHRAVEPSQVFVLRVLYRLIVQHRKNTRTPTRSSWMFFVLLCSSVRTYVV